MQSGWQRAQLNLECVNEDISYSSASQINKSHHPMISTEYFHTVQEIDLPAEMVHFLSVHDELLKNYPVYTP